MMSLATKPAYKGYERKEEVKRSMLEAQRSAPQVLMGMYREGSVFYESLYNYT